MGYSTDFDGELHFTKELTTKEIAKLSKYLGKDRRELGYTDNTIYENGKYGIRWNGAEKTYDLDGIVNWLTMKMREEFPDFELEGILYANGEEQGDLWELRMVNGIATVKNIYSFYSGDTVKCPHCSREFELDES